MKKVFISQPMRGRSEEEIKEEREYLIGQIKKEHGDVEIIDSFIKGNDKKNPLYAISESIKMMADADIICFAYGWENARGCMIEREVANMYLPNTTIIFDNGVRCVS